MLPGPPANHSPLSYESLPGRVVKKRAGEKMPEKSQAVCTLRLADRDNLSSSHSSPTRIGWNLISLKHLNFYCFSPVLFPTPPRAAASLPPRPQPFPRLQQRAGKHQMHHSGNWEKCAVNFDFEKIRKIRKQLSKSTFREVSERKELRSHSAGDCFPAPPGAESGSTGNTRRARADVLVPGLLGRKAKRRTRGDGCWGRRAGAEAVARSQPGRRR